MQRITSSQYTGIDRIVASIGSAASLAIHSLVFIGFFLVALFGVASWELVLLVLTTLVSLEAIYLAIFIQITVNRHTQSLKEVEEDIDEIQEDFEDIQEDIEEISEDIDEIQEDVEELSEEEHQEKGPKKKAAVPSTDTEALDKLSRDVARVLRDLEALKAARKS